MDGNQETWSASAGYVEKTVSSDRKSRQAEGKQGMGICKVQICFSFKGKLILT